MKRLRSYGLMAVLTVTQLTLSGTFSQESKGKGEENALPLAVLIEVKPRMVAYLKVRQTQTKELATKYGKAIDAQLNKARRAGDLKVAEAFQGEKERLKTLDRAFAQELEDPIVAAREAATLPDLDDQAPEALVALRTIWTDERRKIQIKLDGVLQQSLKTVELNFTKAGDFENVKRVLAFRESFSSGAPDQNPSAGVQGADTGNPFREIYSREEYEERLNAAQGDIEASIHLATKTRQPAVGLKLTRVSEELSAEKPEIQVGNILVERGDWKSWARYLPDKLAMPASYVAHFVDADDKDQKVRLKPGIQKVAYTRVYRPDLAYLRNEIGKRDPRWDRHMVLAGFAFASNAKLSETALHHAIAAGYQQDEFSDFCRVVFRTFTKEGPAREMERFFSHFDGKEIPWIYIPPLHSALVATGRIDFMQRIAKEAGGNCVYDASVLEQFLQWTGGKTKWPEGSLLDRAIANRGQSIAKIFRSSRRVQVYEGRRRKQDQLHPGPPIGEPFEFSSPPGEYFHVEYVSDDIPHNIHQHLTLKMVANGIDPGWPTKFRIDWANLYSAQNPPPANPRFHRTSPKTFLRFATGTNFTNTLLETTGNGLPGLILSHENIISIPFVENPVLTDSQQEDFAKNKAELTAKPQVMEIDMIRYHNEIGIFVDGICYLHLPTDPAPLTKIDINIISLGMKVAIEKQEIWELKDWAHQ